MSRDPSDSEDDLHRAIGRRVMRALTILEAAFIYLVILLGFAVAAVHLLNR